jgi:hypothetical protein
MSSSLFATHASFTSAGSLARHEHDRHRRFATARTRVIRITVVTIETRPQANLFPRYLSPTTWDCNDAVRGRLAADSG